MASNSCTDSCVNQYLIPCYDSCGYDDDDCFNSCFDADGYTSCLNSCDNSSSTPSTPSNTSFNVVESVNGANVKFNESVLASEVGQPMFHWYSQLLNLGIVFYPILLVVSGFWFAYGVVKSVINKYDLNNKKSLDNR